MDMLQEERQREAREAEENLRVIRNLMERSTKYSTFSGFSGILAGLASIAGCLVTSALARAHPTTTEFQVCFLLIWSLVIVFTLGADYLRNKRRAARVGKRVISHLGKQMALGSAPGLGTGALLTLFFLHHGLLASIYPVWMLCYGIAVCAVGQFSQREVSLLGAAFLWVGTMTLLLPPEWGLLMMAVSFGGFHILYGFLMAQRDGW
jgi:hypothetical protein